MTTPADGFHFDPAGVRQAISQLEDARDQLRDIRHDAERLTFVSSPSQDQVTLDAARALERTGGSDKGSFIRAMDDGIESVNERITLLRDALTRYGDSDADNAAQLG